MRPIPTEATPRSTCTSIARDLKEPLYATAPVAPAWVLLEQPGAWEPDPLSGGSIDPETGAELARRSKAFGFRILLIRRRAGRASQDIRSCFLIRSAQSGTWMERVEVDGPEALLDIDLQVLTRAAPPGLGEPANHLWAVCTHGRRDPCCAEYGRRLVRSLGAPGGSLGEGLWESSHQGGHRFAANLALFPHGLFYGTVDPPDALQIIAAYREGRVSLEGYRGRSAFDQVTQAADYLVRREKGLTGTDDLVLRSRRELAEGSFEVDFDSADGPIRAAVEVTEGPMRRESCNKPKLTPVTIYKLVETTVR